MAAKKYLNRDNKKQKESADDEWAHLTGTEGPKLQESNAVDVEDRSIFIRGKKPKGTSTTEIIQEELHETGHKTRTTDQYVRLVNAILDQRLLDIERAKRQSKIFDDDLQSLNSESSSKLKDLSHIHVQDLQSNDIAKLIKFLSTEKGNTISRLEHFKTQAYTLEKELLEQDKKINELDNHLKEKIVQESKIKEKKSEERIEDELKMLQELYGADKLEKALKKLNELKES